MQPRRIAPGVRIVHRRYDRGTVKTVPHALTRATSTASVLFDDDAQPARYTPDHPVRHVPRTVLVCDCVQAPADMPPVANMETPAQRAASIAHSADTTATS